MTLTNWISIGTVLVSSGAIFINIRISNRTMRTNREIARENAGKNRVIYEVEEVIIGGNLEGNFKLLNEKLNSGKYTILNVSIDLGNTSQRIYSLGKIKT